MQHGDQDEPIHLPLDGSHAVLGRDETCSVRLSGIGVSRRHAAIDCDPAACVIIDLGSTFGVRVNGSPVKRHALADGDLITLGVIEYQVTLSGVECTLVPASQPLESDTRTTVANGDTDALSIGRDPSAGLVLPHPLVSRYHATAQRQPDGTYLLRDHHSTNGTFVNGRPVKQAVAREGDIIQVGPYRLFIEQGRLTRADGGTRIRLEAFDVTVRSGKKTLLDRACLAVPAGEFVAILGPSGAGKSTLARTLCGRGKTDGGVIYANRLPLKQFLGAFTSNIGYVAQENLLHPELTVIETFKEQSLLRLPRDSTLVERKSRIDEVIGLLELDRVREQRIALLSGGEAKRVHLGIELLASPALIVLDEPLAGLDPGLVRKFMQLFRRISDQGHTVLLTTHTLEQIEFCDRLVFIHRGRIIFTGQPAELESAFGTTALADVYAAAEQGRLPRAPSDVDREAASSLSVTATPIKVRKPRPLSLLRQMALLIIRYFKIMVRDRRNLALMLLQAPLIAVFLALVFRNSAAFLPLSFYFCVTISAIWISGLNASQEIAREWRLLDREYRAGLSLVSYLCAKIAIALVSALIQGALFWLSMGLLFRNFPLSGATLLLVVTGTVGGGILGLCISACSATVGRAITLLPIIFIPQIFFSGILIPFDRMPEAGRLISHCTLSRPVFSLFKQVCLLDRPLAESDAWLSLCFLLTATIILLSGAVRARCAGQ
jgi:ABC-type multidrug transport system ATPase subunit/pSer/pThr/pTyr-binding forkhead associated (FHA) protein/ABC-type multidrug transport system permease subunit